MMKVKIETVVGEKPGRELDSAAALSPYGVEVSRSGWVCRGRMQRGERRAGLFVRS
jgi:hypothetical protein